MGINVLTSTIAIASISYVQAVAQPSYMDIQVTAQVTMPDVLNVEILTPTDLVSLTTAKTFPEGVNTADSFLKGTEKGLFEAVSTADVIYAQLVFIRQFEEFFESLDTTTLNAVLSKTDALGISEYKTLAVDKNVADATSILDMMDGNITYNLIKVLSEFSTVPDAQIIDFSTQKADNIVTDDSGVLSMQDYCDITYFLEDYVGLSRTFT